MTNGRQEIAACTHRYSHQESVGPQMQATCKHGCNRCHDKHCRSIVEKWRHRHCRDKYEGERPPDRSEEHTSELQSLMRNSYAVFCLKKKKKQITKQIL